MTERQNEALKRLLMDAAQGGQAKVDALVALAQRTVWAVVWPNTDTLRTLASSGGLVALPVFTGEQEALDAAQRFGWVEPSGNVPRVELGARAAFRTAVEKNLGFIVVDITSEHSLELTRDEFEPLLSQGRRDSSGPFAATGRIESQIIAAVARRSSSTSLPALGPPRAGSVPTPAPGAPISSSGSIEAPSTLPAGSLPDAAPLSSSAPSHAAAPATSPPAARAVQVFSSMPIHALAGPPDDTLVERFDALLRGYPEVEWACLGQVNGQPVVGLRVDDRLRNRVDAIGQVVAAEGFSVVLLDDPTHFRAARAEAFVFYPWRR